MVDTAPNIRGPQHSARSPRSSRSLRPGPRRDDAHGHVHAGESRAAGCRSAAGATGRRLGPGWRAGPAWLAIQHERETVRTLRQRPWRHQHARGVAPLNRTLHATDGSLNIRLFHGSEYMTNVQEQAEPFADTFLLGDVTVAYDRIQSRLARRPPTARSYAVVRCTRRRGGAMRGLAGCARPRGVCACCARYATSGSPASGPVLPTRAGIRRASPPRGAALPSHGARTPRRGTPGSGLDFGEIRPPGGVAGRPKCATGLPSGHLRRPAELNGARPQPVVDRIEHRACRPWDRGRRTERRARVWPR